ncbi:MAG: polysaccharide biosynthesis protein [Myxococcales bacterium]|nr:polysaccharide biosynthesis protein [Myxococcales bacterium]
MSAEPDDIGRKVTRAVAWVGAASAIVAVFDACALAILMWHWVTPTQFGVASLAATLFYFLDLVTEAGLSSVLIQRESLDDKTLNDVFWLNLITSVAAFALVLGLGPLVGWIQGEPIVGWMLIAYGTKLLYQNVYFIPAALLRREMRFKELSVVRTVANAGDGITKVVFAAMGEPVWCFVAGPLARVLITGIGLQLFRPWRPRGRPSLTGAREMLKFGFKTTGSQYLAHFYNNISHQVVGFYFGSAALGAYRVAYELVLYPINWVSNVVAQVAFPALARLRGRPNDLAAQFLRFSRQNLAVALPLLVLLMVGAEEIVTLVFPRVEHIEIPVRMLCVVGLLRAIDCLYLPLLDAMGFAGRNLAVAGVAAIVLATGDIVFASTLGDSMGFTAVALGRMVGYPIVIAVHASLALGQLGMSAASYVRHLASIVACGVVAVVPGFVLSYLLPPMATGLRLAAVGGISLLTLATLLARFHGLSLRAIVRELRR